MCPADAWLLMQGTEVPELALDVLQSVPDTKGPYDIFHAEVSSHGLFESPPDKTSTLSAHQMACVRVVRTNPPRCQISILKSAERSPNSFGGSSFVPRDAVNEVEKRTGLP